MHTGSGDIDSIEGLRRELSVHMLARGWAVRGHLPTSRSSPFAAGVVGSFSTPLEDQFAAVVMYGWIREDESRAISVAAQIGIDYLPARDMLFALAGSEVSGVMMQQVSCRASISSPEEVGRVADQLVAFAAEQTGTQQEMADVDTLVRALTAHRAVPATRTSEAGLALDAFHPPESSVPDMSVEVATAELIPALFAGAGRRDEARRALHTYALQAGDEDILRQYHRTRRQLARWLETGSEALPVSPPSWPADSAVREPSAGFAESVAGAIPNARARRRALDAVRRRSGHKTRDQLRLLLERELDRHGATMDAQATETALDLLAAERQSFGKARVAFHVMSALRTSMRDSREAQSRATPFLDINTLSRGELDWCRPPERAAYPIFSVRGRSVAVALDQEAFGFLERVKGSGDIRQVEVWLVPHEPSEPGSGLDVHIGAQRVGKLDAATSASLAPAIEAAADRDEDPWTIASLTSAKGEMQYVLEITVPDRN